MTEKKIEPNFQEINIRVKDQVRTKISPNIGRWSRLFPLKKNNKIKKTYGKLLYETRISFVFGPFYFRRKRRQASRHSSLSTNGKRRRNRCHD